MFSNFSIKSEGAEESMVSFGDPNEVYMKEEALPESSTLPWEEDAAPSCSADKMYPIEKCWVEVAPIVCSTTSIQNSNKSNPWPFLQKYFEFTDTKGNNCEFKCVVCAPKTKVISANKKSMYNLKLHVNRVHPYLAQEFNNHIAIATTERRKNRNSFYRETETPTPKKKQKIDQSTAVASRTDNQSKVDQKILRLFVENMLPLEVVDSESFVGLLRTLQDDVDVMSRHALACRIEERFHEAVEDLKTQLSNIQSVATTADCWTYHNRIYLGVTGQWINATTLKREKSVLAYRRLTGPNVITSLAKTLDTIYTEFRIENKVKKITTDNIVKKFRLYKNKELHNPLKRAGEDEEDVTEFIEIAPDIAAAETHEASSGNDVYTLPYFRSAAHTISSIVSDADKALESSNSSAKRLYRSSFAKAWELWNKQASSTQAADAIQAELGEKMAVPNIIRWNSICDSISYLVTIFDTKTTELNRLCQSFRLPMFTTAEMRFLKEYITVVKPVSLSLDILQDEDKGFMGLLLPLLHVCAQKLKLSKEKDLEYCSPLVDALLNGIETGFASQLEDPDCILASAFHPQFKLTWCQDECKLREAKQEMISLVNQKLAENTPQADEEDYTADSFFNVLHETQNHFNEGERLVNNFLEGPVSTVLPSPETFPSKTFLDLFVQYNTAIPSSSAVQRMFSIGHSELKLKRTNFYDEHFEMLVFLKGKV